MTHPLSLSRIINPNPGWYRGDFHAHTNFSDGVHTPLELLGIARTEGLDFFTITDHNTLDAYAHFGTPDDMLILPGNEVTTKLHGHFNVFGIQDEIDWCQSATYPELTGEYDTFRKMMTHTASLGLLNSINHPCLPPWAWLDEDTPLDKVHCLEIWNDPSWPDNQTDNPKAVDLWTRWLNAGYRITAIGGSDYHRPGPTTKKSKRDARLSLPSTYVYVENLSGDAVLNALRKHRAYVSMGPQLQFQAKAAGQIFEIGDTITLNASHINFTAHLSATEITETNGVAQIVKNGQVVVSRALDQKGTALEFGIVIEPGAADWYRFEAWDEEGQLVALSNPIFVGAAPPPTLLTFGDFMNTGAE
ncbi:MAG: CehA/McbA family metallohydrolase [Chloroflexota bacterium]